MKGITPVIAIVLLIGITVAGAGTLWTLVQEQQTYVEDNAPEIQFNTDILNVESCWEESNNVHMQVRNEHPEHAINASALSVYYMYDSVDNQADPGVVNPQRTFRIEIDEDPGTNPGSGETPVIELINNGNTLTHRCFNINN